ncbi:polyadenylate-binding protein RBP47 [Quercus suber]|uniref:polyadenylate-binding protein RBP47 n=1 Tax=Quercus suber TaxID=58331 RepID=UPI000CE1E571|nr:polyadenylate-binding protein RBP47-like isoform X1 [Quercus suber]XP_023921692.1 polyadenylate-binding protein RBP47-like isoform X2 [Quercus suber]
MQSNNGGSDSKPQEKLNNNSNNQQQQQQQRQTPPPQSWVAMQYPAAAMVMQHQMMAPHHQHYGHPPPPPPPPQHYVPYHPYQQLQHSQSQQQQQQQGSSGEHNKTIWVGDLHHWMDENFLHNCFVSTGEIASVKVIRNKQTGLSEGYGFVEFFSHATAEKVLQNYAGLFMPNTEQPFRLNWATFSTGDKRSDNVPDLSIFVGDLAADVTDSLLHETFVSKYPSVKAAKVVFDANTGRSKGYGFVRFGDENERSQAMTEMNGVYCSSRPMRIGAATPRKSSGYQQSQGGYASNGMSAQQADGDSTNTTIFVGGLDPNVSDEDLKQPFSQYGDIVSVKIPTGKGCGFVQFANRNNAEEALQKLNGTVIGKQTVRLSWGRNPANKQFRADYGNQWSGAYYGGQLYDGYGYALPPPHDPSMYAAPFAAYGAYPIYGNQQQVS